MPPHPPSFSQTSEQSEQDVPDFCSATSSYQLPQCQPQSHIWHWQGLAIRYQCAGEQGRAIVLIHGFGASSDHWRKNIPVLATQHRVFAIDLLGFGYSAKPQPNETLAYTFETWGEQVVEFCRQVVGEPVVLVGNSIGCIVAMQAAVFAPELIQRIALLNCSLRLLHERKRQEIPWHERLSAPLLQRILSYRPIGHFFFAQIAQPKVVRRLLLQAYSNPATVTPELIDLILAPAQTPGAADVFLAFTAYSQGPLPEDLLPQVSCPVLLLWGAADPWEPIAKGKTLADFPAVQQFIPLEGVGHCPQDEAPDRVNPILLEWAS
jgi:pimeloyl-ACP methyl ester carboxylesterase